LVEDKPPKEMEELGFTYKNLKEINPSLVMTSITPFGQTEPYRDYKAYHLNTCHAGGEGYMQPGPGNIDRPGCGLSDFKPGRTILDWPDDVPELADDLGINQFAVSGHSSGGPYVAECAYKIPDRLTAAGIVAGIGPLNRPGATNGLPALPRLALWMAGHAPLLLMKPYVWQMAWLTRHPKIIWKGLSSQLPKAEVEIVSRPEFAGFMDGMSEMFRSGNRGVSWDVRVFIRP